MQTLLLELLGGGSGTLLLKLCLGGLLQPVFVVKRSNDQSRNCLRNCDTVDENSIALCRERKFIKMKWVLLVEGDRRRRLAIFVIRVRLAHESVPAREHGAGWFCRDLAVGLHFVLLQVSLPASWLLSFQIVWRCYWSNENLYARTDAILNVFADCQNWLDVLTWYFCLWFLFWFSDEPKLIVVTFIMYDLSLTNQNCCGVVD